MKNETKNYWNGHSASISPAILPEFVMEVNQEVPPLMWKKNSNSNTYRYPLGISRGNLFDVLLGTPLVIALGIQCVSQKAWLLESNAFSDVFLGMFCCIPLGIQ